MREDLRHSRENEEISTSVKEELERLAVDTVEEMWREKKKERDRKAVWGGEGEMMRGRKWGGEGVQREQLASREVGNIL